VPAQVFAVANSGIVGITILRDAGLMGNACDMKVYTDGQFAATLGAAEWTILNVPPSEVILGVDRGFCAGAYVETPSYVQ
jgi:hypothetical protein